MTIDKVDGNDLINFAEAGHRRRRGADRHRDRACGRRPLQCDGRRQRRHGAYIATVNDAGTNWTATIPTADASALHIGTATVTAQVTDLNGNQSALATQLVTVAETGPSVTIDKSTAMT